MALIPKDLQRFVLDGSHATPQYIKPTPAVLQLLEQILDCFRYCPDDTYGNLMDCVEPLCLSNQRHRLIRGIIHILEDRLTFNESNDVDPVELRKDLFEQAVKIRDGNYSNKSLRDEILNSVALKYNIPVEKIDDYLYSDLKSEKLITNFEDITSEELVCEYNLALAKSLLIYARSLQFTISLDETNHAQALRKIFQTLRFFNLLFDVRQITDNTWQFTVDGPSAVLPQPQKYATSLASFLPTLYIFQNWHATASIQIDNKSATWQLKPDDFTPPTMHYAHRLSQETEQLMSRIQQLDPHWQIHHNEPILFFGPQAVWIPDFSMTHSETQSTVHVEVLGFWRADYLNRRLKSFQSAPKNLILVLSDKLKIDAHTLNKTNIQIVTYKRTPRPQDIIAAAMKIK